MTVLSLDSARFLHVDGGRIAYYESGAGCQEILWIHGLPLDSRSWQAQQRFFDSRARNVFVDLRGYGASDKIPGNVESVTALYVADLAALICHLEMRRPMLVGFASAGHVALRLAAQNPDLVGKLAVINASPKFRRGPDWPWGFGDEEIRDLRDAAGHGIQAITDAVLDPAVVFADIDTEQATALETSFREMSVNAGVDSLLGFFQNIANDDDRSLLSDITATTLLMSSTIGKEVPADVSMYLRKNIKNARLVELPGADHFAFATRPELVNRLLDSFLTAPPAD